MVISETIAGLGAIKTAFDMAKALENIHEATSVIGRLSTCRKKSSPPSRRNLRWLSVYATLKNRWLNLKHGKQRSSATNSRTR